ncbi:MAG: ABC transporter permease [Deltaproteobacteria bacterium]|nr:ABC transporter permease [Deltaproteobacteria bacterium]HDM10801.1 ABC transporter permease [Desulfobacteraceae bacterium]
MISSLKNFVVRVSSSRQPLFFLIERDFRARYMGSAAGVVWSVLHPLMMVGVYTLIFSLVFGRNIGDTPFALWLFCALLPWTTFSEIVKSSAGVIERYRNLVTKTSFYPEVLVLVVVGTAITNHIIGLGVLLALLLAVKHTLGIFSLTILFYLVCLILLSLGIGWLVSSVNVFLKDVGQAIGVVLQLWFYLTPIVYPSRIIPSKYHFLLSFNPMYFITEGYRRALLSNHGVVKLDFAVFLLVTICFLMIGGFVFRRLKAQFTEVL